LKSQKSATEPTGGGGKHKNKERGDTKTRELPGEEKEKVGKGKAMGGLSATSSLFASRDRQL